MPGNLEQRISDLIEQERRAATELADSRDWTAPPGESFVILEGIVRGLELAVVELARELDSLSR